MSSAASEEEAAPPARAVTVVHVMTVPNSLFFLAGQGRFMRERGFALHFVASPSPLLARFEETEGARVTPVAMTREITPLRDVGAIWRLWRLLRRLSPEVVHAHTPKGGLVGMIAATLAGVPVRVYHLRGLPLATATGLRRALLRVAERTSCALAHRVISVSPSLRACAVEERLCPPEKIAVLARGSGNGVDALGRLRPADAAARRAARAERGIPEDAPVVGFIGRLARDKGVVELAEAWRALRERAPDAWLFVVGVDEAGDPASRAAVDALCADPRVRHVDGVRFTEMARAYAAMDVLAFPTWREGFPNAPLEAAAMALPVVATAVTGCVDAVVDGVTGTLVPPRDAGALAAALERYLREPALRAAHGAAGRARALEDFRPQGIWEAMAAEYERLVAARARRSPATRPA